MTSRFFATATVTAEDIDNGSNDNCSDVDLAIISGQTTFDCDDVDQSFQLELEVTDAYGNKATCLATVTVSADDLPDTDCDDVADVCDVCPDGDDSMDANGDGLPDCSQILPYAEYSEDWKCKKNKINICHNGNTLCISINALAAHVNNHDDAVGPCQSCGGRNLIPPTDKLTAPYENLNGELEVTISPNPASSMVTLDLHGLEDVDGTLKLFDQMGRELLNQDVDCRHPYSYNSFTRRNISHRHICLRIVSADNMLTKSLIIQR